MAITHNFKEGIDWVADPTGETPLSNRVFVSKDSTSTEDGSPQNPYKTLSAGVVGASNNDTIIIGAGSYTIANINLQTKGISLIGDGYVVFNGDNTTDGIYLNSNRILKNIIFVGYGSYSAVYGLAGARPTIINCTIIDSGYCSNIGTSKSGIFLEKCKLINVSQLKTINNSNVVATETIFINSECANNDTSNDNIKNNHFDENSVLNVGGNTKSSFNNILGVYVNTSSVNDSDNISVNAFFNNKSAFDLSVKASSLLIGAGENGINIGNVIVADSFTQGVAALDIAIDANPNIAFNSLGEIELQLGSGTSEMFETGDIEAVELSVLGATNINGFVDLINNTPDSNNTLVNPNQIILEINVAELDGIYKGYKEYRWNEQPTQNADGTPNGSPSYNWADNNKVRYKKRKYRVTIISNYNPA